MAGRRMFSKDFIESDGFSALSMSARLLYFYLGVHGDDDGFIGQAKRIARAEGIGEDSLTELLQAGFLLDFDNSSVYLLRHWHVNNTLKNDRYTPTDYQTEFSCVTENKNKVYERLPDGFTKETEWKQDGNKRSPQYKIVEIENSEGESNVTQPIVDEPTVTHRSEGESGGQSVPSHWQLMQSLTRIGIDNPTGNQIISRHGIAVVADKLKSWEDMGKPGRFQEFVRGL